jgi:hypothetical protein
MVNEVANWRDVLLQLSSRHGSGSLKDLMQRVLDDASTVASLDECFPQWTGET